MFQNSGLRWISQEHVSVGCMYSWVSSIPALPRRLAVPGVHLHIRPSSIFPTGFHESCLPRHLPMLWKDYTPLWGTPALWSLSLSTATLLISLIQPPLPSLLVTDTFIPCLSFPSCYSRIITWWHILKFNKSGPNFVALHQAQLPSSLTFNVYEELQR